MSRESYQARSDTYQKVKLGRDALEKIELAAQLQQANAEVAALKREIAKLEKGLDALTVRLQDAVQEAGRLAVAAKQQDSPRAKHS